LFVNMLKSLTGGSLQFCSWLFLEDYCSEARLKETTTERFICEALEISLVHFVTQGGVQ
jgi:hypothetical protein